MPTDTDVRVLKRRRRWSTPEAQRIALAAVTILGSLALLAALDLWVFRDPPFVPRLSIRNPTEYDIHVAVAPQSGDELVLVGTAVQHCTTTFELVIDQGPVWQLQLRVQGLEAQPITVTRDELREHDWTVTVPDSTRIELVRAGAPPPPAQRCSSSS